MCDTVGVIRSVRDEGVKRGRSITRGGAGLTILSAHTPGRNRNENDKRPGESSFMSITSIYFSIIVVGY